MSAKQLNGEMAMVGKEDGVWKVTKYEGYVSQHDCKEDAVKAAKDAVERGCVVIWTTGGSGQKTITVP